MIAAINRFNHGLESKVSPGLPGLLPSTGPKLGVISRKEIIPILTFSGHPNDTLSNSVNP